MLNYNHHDNQDRSQQLPIWKVLILDNAAQKIIAPLLKVNDLREHGVTLFFQINSHRDPLPVVPAIYFVDATSANISRICMVTVSIF